MRRTEFITLPEVHGRGWSQRLVLSLLGDADGHERDPRRYALVPLYLLSRVTEAEKGEEFMSVKTKRIEARDRVLADLRNQRDAGLVGVNRRADGNWAAWWLADNGHRQRCGWKYYGLASEAWEHFVLCGYAHNGYGDLLIYDPTGGYRQGIAETLGAETRRGLVNQLELGYAL